MSSGEMAGDVQEKSGDVQRPLFSLAVRGGSLDLWHVRIVLGSVTYLLVELVQSAPVPYPTEKPGALTLGLLLRTRDGKVLLLVPDGIAQAQRLLDLSYDRRPDLRHPPPSFASLHPYYASYSTQFLHPSGTMQNEQVWAMLPHLSVFFIPLWFPLIVWPISKQTRPYASRQAKQAFFFHLIINSIELLVTRLLFASNFMSEPSTLMTPSGSSTASSPPLGYFLSIWLLAMLIGIMNMRLVIYGGVQGYQGKPFHYPMLGRV